MDDPEFRRQIGQAWTFFDSNLKLGRAFVWARSIPVDEDFRRVALAPESSYLEIYISGLSRSAYNFILHDYSYFQFGWDSEHAWRMAYLPNPWITGVSAAQQTLEHWETLEEIGALTYEDASDFIVELPYKGAVPSIRFEYSRLQYREVAHPAAHFHIGRDSNNRWPCALLLGPLAFCMMIARLYYVDQWAPGSRFHGKTVQPEKCLDLWFADVIQKSQAVPEFSDMERRSFHFGRNILVTQKAETPQGHGPRRRHR